MRHRVSLLRKWSAVRVVPPSSLPRCHRRYRESREGIQSSAYSLSYVDTVVSSYDLIGERAIEFMASCTICYPEDFQFITCDICSYSPDFIFEIRTPTRPCDITCSTEVRHNREVKFQLRRGVCCRGVNRQLNTPYHSSSNLNILSFCCRGAVEVGDVIGRRSPLSSSEF